MQNDLDVFDEFMKTRESVAQAFVNGEFAPLRSIATEVSPATFFGPNGDYLQGAIPVLSRYEHDAGLFESGSTSLEVLHAAASGELAFWVGLQRAVARLDKTNKQVTFDLRVTELFRREDGGWKLIHRHADALADGSRQPKL